MTGSASRILLVEDEKHAREGVAEILKGSGHTLTVAENLKEARARAKNESFDLLLSDIRLPDGSGLDLAVDLKKSDPDLPVVLMTAYGSVRDAVQAMQKGVDHYLTKPLDFDELRLTVSRLIEGKSIKEENRRLRVELGARDGFKHLVGQSSAWKKAVEMAKLAATTDSAILLMGESGTGKELVAHAVHHASPNSRGPFVALNCAAIPASLLENELFGHEPGAFTGATKRYVGKVEAANHGTLLLDEVGDMPLELQAKILRLIENKTLMRLGGSVPVTVDFRVIASTNRDLPELIKQGKFREDLYYRLNVISVFLPPLRERRGDIPLLLDYFLEKISRERGVAKPVVNVGALGILAKHAWFGNVRELENFAERTFVLTPGGTVSAETVAAAFPPSPLSSSPANEEDDETDLAGAVRTIESRKIRRALTRAGGNRTQAALLLGISLRTLQYKMKQHDIL